jgi:hypothetical protein
MPGRHQISQQASAEENAKLIMSMYEAYKDVDGTSNLTNRATAGLVHGPLTSGYLHCEMS